MTGDQPILQAEDDAQSHCTLTGALHPLMRSGHLRHSSYSVTVSPITVPGLGMLIPC